MLELSNCNRDCMASVNSVQSLSSVPLFETPWTAACQASLPITMSLPKLMSIESVMASNHLILCCPLLLPPSVFPSIRVFSNESVLRIRWLKYMEFQLQHQPCMVCSGSNTYYVALYRNILLIPILDYKVQEGWKHSIDSLCFGLMNK